MAVVEYMGYPRGELLPLEKLIDPSNALMEAFKAVQTPGGDAHRTVHYVMTDSEIQRGGTGIPSLLLQGNHTAGSDQSEGAATAGILSGFLHGPPTHAECAPFFLPLSLADLMADCEGNRLDPIPVTVTQAMNTRRRASLKRMIGHLTTVTDGALSLPAALAELSRRYGRGRNVGRT